MKKIFLTVAFSLFAAFVISCGSGKSVDGIEKGNKSKLDTLDTSKLGVNHNIVKGNKSKLDTLSYVIGMNISQGMSRDLGPMKLNTELFKNTLEAAALGDTLVMCGETSITAESAPNQLSEFFMTKYGERVQKLRAQELAKRDSKAAPVELDFNPETMFASDEEQNLISSAMGFATGADLIKSRLPLQTYWLLMGYDEAKSANVKITLEQAEAFMNNYFTVVIPQQNKKESEEWLAQVEKESGVKKTESGLLYKVVTEGDMSAKATSPTDTVKVHYKGTTRRGEVFDASRFADMPTERQEMLKRYQPDTYMNDTPIEFPLNRVIKGWTEGMQLVGKGGKIILWIPGELAYGERGVSNLIGPNDALKFEVDLIDVKPAK